MLQCQFFAQRKTEITGGKKIEIFPGTKGSKFNQNSEIKGETPADIADLVAIGFDIQCYDDTVGGNLLSSSTMLTNGTNYYISQIIDGCESLNRLKITVIITNPTTNTTTETECDSYFWTQNGQIYTSSGTYTYLNGCHTEELVLTINQVSNNLISVENQIVTANNVNATYQWLDCNNSLAALTNETKQSFTATQNGSYAGKIIQNTWIDTSACFVITNVGVLKNIFSNDIVVYPNPTSGFVTVNMGKVFANFSASLHDLNGKLISQSFYKSTKMFSLHLEVPSGVYLLTINDGNSKATIRLIKQ